MKTKLTELKGEIDNSKIIVGNFNTKLSKIDRTTRQKIEKKVDLNNTKNQLDLIETYRYFIQQPENIHLLKCTQNILQHRPYVQSQNKFQ